MNTTPPRIAVTALAAVLSAGLVACGTEDGASAKRIDTVSHSVANVPQTESGFGPRLEHWPPATDVLTADPYSESGFGPRLKHWAPATDAPTADPYNESGFGPRR